MGQHQRTAFLLSAGETVALFRNTNTDPKDSESRLRGNQLQPTKERGEGIEESAETSGGTERHLSSMPFVVVEELD